MIVLEQARTKQPRRRTDPMFGEADSTARSDTALCPVYFSFSDMNDGDGQPIIKNEDWNFIEQCTHKMVNSVEHRPEPINETELRKLEGCSAYALLG
ncbi:hypothetical protein NL676_020890 [Syzygium grande]|nr:hypothetical protein NL676_020890 [Syzygium grande]